MNIPPILKNKWVLGGGALCIVIVLLMSGGGASASGGTVVASGPSDAEVMASRDITLAQLNAQVSSNAANAQLAAITQQGQIDLAKAGLDSQLNKYAIDAQLAIQSMQASTSREIQLASLASDERRELASINGQMQLQKWTLDQATANAQIQSDFQLQYAEAANQTNISLAQMQAQLVNNQLVVNRDVALAGLNTQTELAAINASLQRDVTYSNNATQAAVYASMINGQVEQTRISSVGETERARIMAGVEKKKSSNSLIGGIIGGALSLFSDPRLKTDVRRVGTEADGLGVYEFRYAGSGPLLTGVMADEVAILRPWALGETREGFATVDYTRLN